MIFILGFAPESFSETDLKTVEIFVQPPTGFTVDDDMKNNDEKLKPQNSPNSPIEMPTSFVTGNEYALNSNAIYINTDEGLSLNNLLIEQIETERKNIEHMDSFWSRTDQLIMGNFGVINALQIPSLKTTITLKVKSILKIQTQILNILFKNAGMVLII